MSIPPLVCSTPPPPDQCEDDKDPEDFDLQYNLSQDDDEGNYDFEDFSSYNHFQSTMSSNNKIISSTALKTNDKSDNIKICKNIVTEVEQVATGSKNNNEDKLKHDEDITVEDLNLSIDQNIDVKVLDIPENISLKDKRDSIDENIWSACNKLDTVESSHLGPLAANLVENTETRHTNIFIEQLPDENSPANPNIEKEKSISSDIVLKIAEVSTDSYKNVSEEQLHIKSEIKKINEAPIRDAYVEDNEFCDLNNDNVKEPVLSEVSLHNSIQNDDASVFNNYESKQELGIAETLDNAIGDDKNSYDFNKDMSPKSSLQNINIDRTDVGDFGNIVLGDTINIKSMSHSSISDNDDGFGDFADYIHKTENDKAVLVANENPWQNDNCEENDFSEFTANFENNLSSENSPERKQSNEIIEPNMKEGNNLGSEDDFGDFDDFKSSNVEMTTYYQQNDMSMLSLHSSDNEIQLFERVNKVLCTIFVEELTEDDTETEFEGKIESYLCETWGHLVDRDVRQPYMVNWNNSMGQKSLLKALCIDSRNILFGPKWSNNLPRYATNLTSAPLQPQKPSMPTNLSESSNSDKSVNKTSDSWMDPFTSNGQESCTSEVQNVPVERKQTEVYDFDASTNQSKIYSSTLSVQPFRHINLPDTHIFTPTDSETPRSKTIHYDSPIVLPQNVTESNKTQTNKILTSTPDSSDAVNTVVNHDDFTEFEDYKSATFMGNSSTHQQVDFEAPESQNKTNITYQTQILQPIKIEPMIPTLNWPDPGEVIETYENFTDFLSNKPWTQPQEDISSINANNHTKNNTIVTVPSLEDKAKSSVNDSEQFNLKQDDDFDDFDSFKSAPSTLTSIGPINYINTNSLNNFEHISNQLNTMSDNNTAVNNATVSKQSNIPGIDFQQNQSPYIHFNQDNITKAQEIVNSPVNTPLSFPLSNVLQPTQATTLTSVKSSQNVGQILQPLSLESISQINWPNPGIDLQDLSRFNPVESLQSLKGDSTPKGTSPVHNQKKTVQHQNMDDDIWGEFVSSKPNPPQTQPKKPPPASIAIDDDEWTDYTSGPSVLTQNGLNTISFNVHTNLSMQKLSKRGNFPTENNQSPIDIPRLNYITPKSNLQKTYHERHFQNL